MKKKRPLSDDHKEALAAGRQKYWDTMDEEERKAKGERLSEAQKKSWAERPRTKAESDKVNAVRGQHAWLSQTPPEEIRRLKARGPHTRFHVKGEKPNPNCTHCINENLV